MRKFSLVQLSVLMALGMTSAAASMSTANAAEKVRWKMASVVPTTLPIVGDGAVYFTDKVREISAGKIDIRPFDPGKLVPATEVFDAVRAGSVDAGWSFSCYWMGKNTATPLFCTVPFGLSMSFYLSWMYEGGGQELYEQLYAKDKLWATPCGITPPEASGWFRKEVTSPDQFKGMKVRYPGIAGNVLQKMGASVQLIPGGDIFVALERGVIDATEFSVPSVDLTTGFYKVAKHYYFPGWHQPATISEFVVAKDKWDALDPIDRAIIKTSCRDNIVRSMSKFEAAQGEALKKIRAQGVTIHKWSPDMLAAFQKATDEVMADMSKANPDFAKIYASLKAFQDATQEWHDLSAPMR